VQPDAIGALTRHFVGHGERNAQFRRPARAAGNLTRDMRGTNAHGRPAHPVDG
jgi:hypothetical protein